MSYYFWIWLSNLNIKSTSSCSVWLKCQHNTKPERFLPGRQESETHANRVLQGTWLWVYFKWEPGRGRRRAGLSAGKNMSHNKSAICVNKAVTLCSVDFSGGRSVFWRQRPTTTERPWRKTIVTSADVHGCLSQTCSRVGEGLQNNKPE